MKTITLTKQGLETWKERYNAQKAFFDKIINLEISEEDLETLFILETVQQNTIATIIRLQRIKEHRQYILENINIYKQQQQREIEDDEQ